MTKCTFRMGLENNLGGDLEIMFPLSSASSDIPSDAGVTRCPPPSTTYLPFCWRPIYDLSLTGSVIHCSDDTFIESHGTWEKCV